MHLAACACQQIWLEVADGAAVAGMSLPVPGPQDSSAHLLKSLSSKLLQSLRRSSSDPPGPLTTQLSNLGRENSATPSTVGLLEPSNTPRLSGQLSGGPALVHSPSKKSFFFKGALSKANSDPKELTRVDSGSPLLSTLAMTTLSRVSEDRVLLDNRNGGALASDAPENDANAAVQPSADSALGPDDFRHDQMSRQESSKSRMSFAIVGETLRSNFKTAAAKINRSKKTLARTLPIVDT